MKLSITHKCGVLGCDNAITMLNVWGNREDGEYNHEPFCTEYGIEHKGWCESGNYLDNDTHRCEWYPVV